MKKIVPIFLVLILISLGFIADKTITLKEYLSNHSENQNQITVNSFGFAQYKNKVILKDNLVPLTKNTARTTIEIKVILTAEKIQPEKDCDPSDTDKNGTMGCYIRAQ